MIMLYTKKMRVTSIVQRKPWLLFSCILLTICLVSFISLSLIIDRSVNQLCHTAQQLYNSSCVDALTHTVDDEHRTYRERNDAIWALGQLGDPTALPTLQTHYSGNTTNAQYDEELSQYELQKAIKLLEGGINITRLVRW